MATRGRKPKPTALKVLEGNPGKRPLNTDEPKPKKKAPKCPSWLEPEAKKEWRRMSKTLEKIGVLTQVDGAAFAGYCQAYARWREAEEFLTKHGTIKDNGYRQYNTAYVEIPKKNGKSEIAAAIALYLTCTQPLFFLITTAGTDRNSICYEVHQKADDILRGKKIDPTFYPVIYGIKDDDNWADESNWYKAK